MKIAIWQKGFPVEGLLPTSFPRMDFAIPPAYGSHSLMVQSSSEQTNEAAQAEAETRDEVALETDVAQTCPFDHL